MLYSYFNVSEDIRVCGWMSQEGLEISSSLGNYKKKQYNFVLSYNAIGGMGIKGFIFFLIYMPNFNFLIFKKTPNLSPA